MLVYLIKEAAKKVHEAEASVAALAEDSALTDLSGIALAVKLAKAAPAQWRLEAATRELRKQQYKLMVLDEDHVMMLEGQEPCPLNAKQRAWTTERERKARG